MKGNLCLPRRRAGELHVLIVSLHASSCAFFNSPPLQQGETKDAILPFAWCRPAQPRSNAIALYLDECWQKTIRQTIGAHAKQMCAGGPSVRQGNICVGLGRFSSICECDTNGGATGRRRDTRLPLPRMGVSDDRSRRVAAARPECDGKLLSPLL